MPLDFDALARQRRELRIEASLKQLKESKAISKAGAHVVDEQAKQMSERVKMAKDVLKLIPKPSKSQKEERKKTRVGGKVARLAEGIR